MKIEIGPSGRALGGGRAGRRRVGCRGDCRRPPSARRPPATRPRRRRSPSGARRPGARSFRPARVAASARRTSATSSRARRPCTWASSTSRSTTPRWRSRAATSRTRSRSARRMLPRGGDRDRDARHARRPARARPQPAQQAILDGDYVAYMNAIADGPAKDSGIAVGRKVAAAVLALRAGDGLEKNPTVADLDPPAARPRRVATRARGGAGPSPARSEAARAHERRRSSGPTARTR